MQKALENPHYKKIWEKVMMNRHPEVKSLEEALKMEAYQDGCLFYNTKENMYGLNIANNILTRYTPLRKDDGFCRHKYTEFDYQAEQNTEFDYQAEPLYWQYGYNFEILGRPITLEDILIVCRDCNIKRYAISNKQNIISLYEIGLDKYFDWQLTKPLHEQNTEVLENISKLID